MKIVHTGDWHIGPSRNRIDPESGLNSRLMDFARCARFTIEDGIERGAQLILHAGDVFGGGMGGGINARGGGSRPTPTERRLALDALQPAIAAGIPVLIITGNHDVPRSPAERHALDTLREEPGITIIDRACILEAWRGPLGHLLLSAPATDAERRAGDTTELQIAALPWPNASLLLQDAEARRLEPGERNLIMRQRMMDVARGLREQCRDGIPSVLLAHCSLDVATVGDRMMMMSQEWTLNAADVSALGFDAVLLGHIHGAQECAQRIWYSGSPEACTFGEEGEQKSYLLVDIPPDDPEGIEIEQVPTPYRRFITIDGDVGAPGQPVLADCEGAIVRLRIPEASASQAPEIRRQIEAAGAVEIGIEIQRAESVRRAGASDLTHGMGVELALRTWAAQRPDLEPLTDELVAEALAIEGASQGGGA